MKLFLRLAWTSPFALAVAALLPAPALAYVGPGAGLSAIGAFVALVIAVAAALLGFIWYPVKRLLRKLRKTTPPLTDEPPE